MISAHDAGACHRNAGGDYDEAGDEQAMRFTVYFVMKGFMYE
jgi:hypothetical protein